MNSSKKRTKSWPLPVCLAGMTCLTPAMPVKAQTQSAAIQNIRTVADHGVTLVDVALSEPMTASVRNAGNSLVVTLPKAGAVEGLVDHLRGAGLVSGIGLQDLGWGQRITLVLRSPADGKIVTSPNSRTVRIAVAPVGHLALLSRRSVPTPAMHRLPEIERPTECVFPVRRKTTPRPVMVAVPVAIRPPAMIAPAETAPTLPEPAVVLTPVISVPKVRLYNVNAYQSDLAGVLNSLAQDSHVSIVMAGNVSSKVTMSLHQVPLEKAVDLLTKAAGLSYHHDGDVFVIGDAKGLEAAYPTQAAVVTQSIYRCVHVSAADVVTALQNTFDKDKLRVSIGATPSSPRLDDASTSEVTGVQGNTMKNADTNTGGLSAHLIVLSGDAGLVAQALDLAQKLDVRRTQVKIGVQITDINRSALKNLGLQWSFGSLNIRENQADGIGFGSFTRDPFAVSATITALENSGRAKLLAAPNMSILDGERGFILIGDRIQYPKLTGYTQAQTPIYDVTEERVGIYLQVAVQMEDNGEITLTIYPQISTVSGYLNVNGASYPQISTREQQTTIRVKDGQQIVVGGLIRDEEINNVQKVPILSSIPLFKELFTYRNTNKQQSEVVIVITPQILKD